MLKIKKSVNKTDVQTPIYFMAHAVKALTQNCFVTTTWIMSILPVFSGVGSRQTPTLEYTPDSCSWFANTDG